jgi:MYXO-CTERM domain-containing protein
MKHVVALALAGAALAVTQIVSAQSTKDNLGKYWALRQRLNDEFTVVGDGPGKSQPADERRDSQGYIRWADSTIRLGWYTGVLASEYYLVTHPVEFPGADGGDSARAAKTRDDLYYALRAMERLDEVADASFPLPCTQAPALNGFFIRDDVPADFHLNFPPLTETRSDFVDPVLTNKEMSQDQVYHVLIGLALTKALVPQSATSNGKVLPDYAVEQARRIIEHVSADGWVIKNPACDNRNVQRGPLASGFSGGTRLAIGFITDGAYLPDTSESLINVWDGAQNPAFAAYIDIDSLHMAMAIAAVGDGWGADTADSLATLAAVEDWPLYPLLHRALHGDLASGWCKTGTAINTSAKKMLDELPIGAEPASPQPGTAVHGFTRSNRFLRGKDQAYTGEPGSDGLRFNGLDYMLLHNLFAIATPATWDGGNGAGIPECSAAEGGAGGGSSAGPAAAGEDSGCGCRSAPSGRAPADLGLLALAAVATIARRKRYFTDQQAE